MKKCRRCGIEKRIQKFKVDKRQPDGRTVSCRSCYETNKLKERNKDPIQIQNCRKKSIGKKHSLEWRLAISRGQKRRVEKGEHPWKVNINPHKDTERSRIKYKIWKEQLVCKAQGKCEDCGSEKRLHAHHIKCFYKFPELRFSLENGKILCQSCHSKLHKTRDKTGRRAGRCLSQQVMQLTQTAQD